MRVFKNKFGSWNTLFKNKMLNGEEIKYYMPVQFQKGYEPSKDSIDIEPLKWWGSCFLGKVDHNGTEEQVAKPKLFIADWREELPKAQPDNEIDRSIEQFKAQNYADELPFY